MNSRQLDEFSPEPRDDSNRTKGDEAETTHFHLPQHANANGETNSPCFIEGCQCQVVNEMVAGVVADWISKQKPTTREEGQEGEEPQSTTETGEKQGSRQITQPMMTSDLKQASADEPSVNDEAAIWSLGRHANANDEKKPCFTEGCQRQVVALWVSNQNPPAKWFTCEECQRKDFDLDGWPEEEIPKLSNRTLMPSVEAKSSSKDNDTNSSTKKRFGAKKGQPKTKRIKARIIDNSGQPSLMQRPPPLSSQCSPVTPSPVRPDQDGWPGPMQHPSPLRFQCPPIFPSPVLPTSPSPRSPSINDVVQPQIGVPNLVPKTDGSKSKLTDQRVVATIKRCKKSNNNGKVTWTNEEPPFSTPNITDHTFKLRRGGTCRVVPNMIPPEILARIEQEVLNSGLFRQYSLQGQDEPRVHCLLHGKATDNFEAMQPVYGYAHLWMKARPLSKLPHLQGLAKDLAAIFGVDSWNIGVNPVLYRGSNDSMGEHADDDQGEKLILCLIVSSPKGARRVRITTKTKGEDAEDDDERIDLMLAAGDAYVMDGEMQKYYFHSVPKSKETVGAEESFRLSIVFRTGNDVYQLQDSGRPCENLAPKIRPAQIFGNKINGLDEGTLYSRAELFNMGAHRMQQRGISGNVKAGADAMIVSGLREDKLGVDHFCKLVYAVEQVKGGMSVMTSFNKGLPIRVFRSSNYQSRYKAISMSEMKDSSTKYRYDGLYKVVKKRDPVTCKGPFIFELCRVEAGTDENSNRFNNREVFVEYIKMGTMSTLETYPPVETCDDLIQNVVDKAVAYYGRNEDPPCLHTEIVLVPPLQEVVATQAHTADSEQANKNTLLMSGLL
ncbi:unnamed protein product [Cylindrotheca closterium]|uniref:YDG domain-containing protein n=1 Tax=Cylindrotheca closterium TaxID=2856 RepID=A0AAD2FVE1_9STRA|nr:unnamed protein product [Cylindrotheca closterium]